MSRRRSGQSGELAKTLHFCTGSHGPVLLHHRTHLEVLLENRVDVLHGGAASFGDALAAFSVDDVVVAALLVGHGIDDGFDARELALINFRILGKVLKWSHLRQHVNNLFERTHFANLLQLIAKIFQRKFFLAELTFEIGSGFFVDGLFHTFNKRHEIAHAENAGDDALGIKTFEGIVLFAEADELYRGAGDFTDGKCRAAARVAIEFGENYAGEPEALVEFSRGAHGILTNHGIGDEKHFAGLQFFLQHAQLVHQIIVNVQAAGSVHQNDVAGG